jgi:hypothetical protein
MRPQTPSAVENGVGKLAAKARLMPAWERESGELPAPNLSPFDRKISGDFLFLPQIRLRFVGTDLVSASPVMKFNPARSIFLPFFCGLLIMPSFIFFHECGHYAVARYFGLHAQFRSAEVRITGTDTPSFYKKDDWIVLAGPLTNFLLMIAGFVWLRCLRQRRIDAPPTWIDWLATVVALNAGRWLRCFAGTPAHPQPADEAQLSRIAGCPPWVLPYLLGILAVWVIVMIIRLHPPGSRLIPFTSIFTGGALGAFLWVRVVGPFLFP